MSGFFNSGQDMIAVEDMETSDSDDSHAGEQPSDDEWVESVRRPKKRNSKTKERDPGPTHLIHRRSILITTLPPELQETRSSSDVDVYACCCCTCSKSSSCKTIKCECRASGGLCSESCGCLSSKCSLRRGSSGKTTDGEAELATQGATLLQNALSQMPPPSQQDQDNNKSQRKPLSDIGKSNVPRAEQQRKKWRKSVIHLVPVASANTPTLVPEQQQQQQQQQHANKPEASGIEIDNSIKLPRAMRTQKLSSSNLLRERNTEQHQEESSAEESGIPLPRTKKQAEKENNGV